MSNIKKINQKGVVSIFVTMIMMLVISLIVIGFAQVARRNQREALDRQLSTQAYYAAESGVNAAAKYFVQNPTAAPIDTLSTPNCTGVIGTVQAPITLDSGGNVKTTCLMANSKPAWLQANPVGQDSNIVWHAQNNDINGATGLPYNFTSLTFTWNSNGSYNGTNTCASTVGTFPHFSGAVAPLWNCAFGILRVDLVDVSTFSQANLQNNTKTWTVYMVPHGLSSSATTASAPTLTTPATVVSPVCNSSTKQCSVKLTGIVTAGTFSSEYYVRVTTMYQDSDSVTLRATDTIFPVSGDTFRNGQAIIDATGKAQDELRRIQVRVPLIRPDSTIPIYGLQSTQSLCKQLRTSSTVTTVDSC